MTFREQVAVVNKGDSHDYTKVEEFVNWFGTADFQGKWAEKFNAIPAAPAALEKASPRTKELVNEFKPMDADWDFANDNLSDWLEKIELELMPG